MMTRRKMRYMMLVMASILIALTPIWVYLTLLVQVGPEDAPRLFELNMWGGSLIFLFPILAVLFLIRGLRFLRSKY